MKTATVPDEAAEAVLRRGGVGHHLDRASAVGDMNEPKLFAVVVHGGRGEEDALRGAGTGAAAFRI